MLRFAEATLVFVGQTKYDDGSPKQVEISKTVKAVEQKTFSLNFYNTSGTLQRSMRQSKNLVLPKELTDDIIQDGIRYELLYIDYYGLRYRVHNILHYRRNALRVLVDMQELR